MDLGNYLRFIAALIFVLALIAGATWLARRFGFGTRAAPRRSERRLSVVEVATIDSKHRAVLLRRDDKEHLVVIGGASDMVVETGIDAPDGTPAAPPRDRAPRMAGE